MSEPSPEAKQAADWKPYGAFGIELPDGERVWADSERCREKLLETHNTATAKAREELETAQHLAELWETAERNAVKELAKTREELAVSHRLEQAAWKVANERLDQQPSAPTAECTCVRMEFENHKQGCPLAPTTENQLNSLARDASKAWSHHNKGYSSATKPLWKIIEEACRMAYILGKTDADYEAGRALTSLDSPTADVGKWTDETVLALLSNPQHEDGWHLHPDQTRRVYEAHNLILAQARAPLVEALKKARETIHALHGDEAWEIYEKHSPEMKMIDAALAGTGEKEALAGKTGNNKQKGDK